VCAGSACWIKRRSDNEKEEETHIEDEERVLGGQ
jgi:hypothetical protein